MKNEEEAKYIMSLLRKGNSLERISELVDRDCKYLERNYGNFSMNCGLLNKTLGYKDSPYYENEDQMLNPPTYDYESLSEDEKELFHKL